MATLAVFMKKNKKQRENAFYPATKSIVDDKGNPIMWEIRPVTTREDEEIRDSCMKEIPVPGKRGQFRQKIDINTYLVKQMVAAIVYPNLLDAALQDSYGVKTAEDLLRELVDNPSEFADLGTFIREHSGFDADMAEEIEEAKN